MTSSKSTTVRHRFLPSASAARQDHTAPTRATGSVTPTVGSRNQKFGVNHAANAAGDKLSQYRPSPSPMAIITPVYVPRPTTASCSARGGRTKGVAGVIPIY